jgi:hypothetical protein
MKFVPKVTRGRVCLRLSKGRPEVGDLESSNRELNMSSYKLGRGDSVLQSPRLVTFIDVANALSGITSGIRRRARNSGAKPSVKFQQRYRDTRQRTCVSKFHYQTTNYVLLLTIIYIYFSTQETTQKVPQYKYLPLLFLGLMIMLVIMFVIVLVIVLVVAAWFEVDFFFGLMIMLVIMFVIVFVIVLVVATWFEVDSDGFGISDACDK